MKFIKVTFILNEGTRTPNDAHLMTGEHFISTNDVILLTKTGNNTYSVNLKPEAMAVLPKVVSGINFQQIPQNVLDL